MNAFLDGRAWFDFMISEMGEDLHIIGSTDLCYYQELEVVFEDATFLTCSSSWNTSPADDTVFSLGDTDDQAFVNTFPNNGGYSLLVKIKPEDSSRFYYIACHGIRYSARRVTFRIEPALEDEKSALVQKYNLSFENGAWYRQRENSHKHLIFRDDFYSRSDLIGLLFRLQKLCIAKVRYFRAHLAAYEPYKYHYKDGFIKTELWDSDFLKHKASGFLLDYRQLQSITRYSDFVELCRELESFEPDLKRPDRPTLP